MGDIFLRYALLDDGMFLLELANNRECRENAFDSHKITIEEHMSWLEKILHSETKKQYILMDGTVPVGQGRLETEDDTCKISYDIIPERRGCGYGKLLIQLLNNAALKDLPNCSYSYGEVLKGNIASQKVFEELGYTGEEQKECFCYRKHIEYIEISQSVNSLTRGE